jgi:hypothetical protein
MKVIPIILLIFLSGQIICSDEIINTILDNFGGSAKDLFKVYHHLYKKPYDLNSEEGIRRYKIFKASYKLIQEINSSKLSYTMGLNSLSDVSEEELIGHSEYSDLKDIPESKFLTPHQQVEQVIQNRIDWSKNTYPPRDLNVDQIKCFRCYSIPSVLEALMNINYGYGCYLSVAQLKECTNRRQAEKWIFDYVRDTGLVVEAYYPNSKEPGSCDNNRIMQQTWGTIKSTYELISISGDSAKLVSHLKSGPVLAFMDIAAIQSYKGGVFESTQQNRCDRTKRELVSIFGYNPIDNSYMVRPNFGTSFGERGYLKVKAGSGQLSCFLEELVYVLKLIT